MEAIVFLVNSYYKVLPYLMMICNHICNSASNSKLGYLHICIYNCVIDLYGEKLHI